MGDHPRKADGRRIFSAEFKRTQVQRILTGEKTLAELSRELDIRSTVIRNWKRHYEAGATTAVAANEDVVPASQLREAYQRIRELERALGRKTMEVEILQAAQELVKNRRRCAEAPGDDRPSDDRDLPGAGDRAPAGVLRRPRAPAGPLSPGVRRDRPRADPGGDQQPCHLRVSAGDGRGETGRSGPATIASAFGA